MLKKYCTCGAATEYSLTLPKCCSSCGTNFNASATVLASVSNSFSRPVKKKRIIEIEEDEEDDDYEESGGSLNFPKKLNIKVTYDGESNAPKRIPLTSLASQPHEDASWLGGRDTSKLTKKARKLKTAEIINSMKPAKRGDDSNTVE